MGGLVLIGLIVAGLWPQPTPVETAPVQRGKVRATVNEEGKTRLKQRYLVSAPVAGQLRRISLKAGAPVKEGELVATIDPLSPSMLDARSRSLAVARRDTAAANLAKCRDAQTFATSELHRIEKLYADRTVAIQDLESAQWRDASAVRDTAAAESALRLAEADLADFHASADPVAAADSPALIKAPVDGKVLKVFEESSRVVAAGAALLEIGNPADLEVVIEVLSRDGAVIPPGTPIELEQWGGDEPLQAQVRLVEPGAFTKVSALGVEEQRVRVVADILTPPNKRPGLGDQFRVEAHIIVWQTEQALKVPAGALFRQGDQWAVFVREAGRAKLRLVKAGHASGTETEILEGLKEGESVILYPGDRIRDGQRLKDLKI